MNEELKLALQGIGAIAEMALIFYRAPLGTVATEREAMAATQAYMAALMFGNRQEEVTE